MNEEQLEQILELDVEERLRVVQIIWDSIAAAPAAIPLTPAERAELDRRIAEDDADPDDVVSCRAPAILDAVSGMRIATS